LFPDRSYELLPCMVLMQYGPRLMEKDRSSARASSN
jgi:hypothetical protein